MVNAQALQRGLQRRRQKEQDELAAAIAQEGLELVRELGEGGEGKTYLLEKDGKHYAGKFLTPEDADAKSIEKLLHEAEVLQHLDHPRIPKYDGLVELPELGGILTRREFIDDNNGRTSLRDLLKENKGLPEEQVAKVMDSVLEILEYLHDPAQHPAVRVPIVHRDIKPENVFVNAENEAYVIDFGVAKANNNTFTQVTAKGTRQYMPPEQLVGDGYPQSDLYALGVTALEMLLSQVPEQFTKGYTSVKNYEVPAVANLNPALKEILELMVRSEYSERPKSAGKVRQMLREKGLLRGERIDNTITNLEESVDLATAGDYDVSPKVAEKMMELSRRKVELRREIARRDSPDILMEGAILVSALQKKITELSSVNKEFYALMNKLGYSSIMENDGNVPALFNINGTVSVSYFHRPITGTNREQILIETAGQNRWFKNKPFTGCTYAETLEGEKAEDVVRKIMNNSYGDAEDRSVNEHDPEGFAVVAPNIIGSFFLLMASPNNDLAGHAAGGLVFVVDAAIGLGLIYHHKHKYLERHNVVRGQDSQGNYLAIQAALTEPYCEYDD
ncbi:serine/threonine protein kinase [Candidatus Woesearchaeota archaeon]|nr:serine/threonine protein kinase [Candidatus Woesearchaeota archaeon]